jgi:hypothetical protein
VRSRTPASSALRGAARMAIGFLAGLILWALLSPAYERTLAASAEMLLRATEWPAVSRLEARKGEILVERLDFPPAAPRPGLPTPDLHFNFVLLVALFALSGKPWRGEWIAGFLLGGVLLWLVHSVALVFQVRSLYATRLGAWSAAHYGVFARNFWAGGFHFYQVAGRFAAPFAIWWPFGRGEQFPRAEAPGRDRPSRKAGGSLRVVK